MIMYKGPPLHVKASQVSMVSQWHRFENQLLLQPCLFLIVSKVNKIDSGWFSSCYPRHLSQLVYNIHNWSIMVIGCVYNCRGQGGGTGNPRQAYQNTTLDNLGIVLQMWTLLSAFVSCFVFDEFRLTND